MSANHDLLFEYLERAFKRDKLFGEDIRKLKGAIREGACTVSDRQAQPASHLKQKARKERSLHRSVTLGDYGLPSLLVLR